MYKAVALTLKSLVVVVIAVALLTAMLISVYHQMRRQALIPSCQVNLKSLWEAQYRYAIQHGSPNHEIPEGEGVEFHLRLQRGPKPVIERYEPFVCPLTDETPGAGKCSYRGPAISIRKASKYEDPVASDKEGNHGSGQGGNVVTIYGDIRHYEPSDSMWLRARVTTKE